MTNSKTMTKLILPIVDTTGRIYKETASRYQRFQKSFFNSTLQVGLSSSEGFKMVPRFDVETERDYMVSLQSGSVTILCGSLEMFSLPIL